MTVITKVLSDKKPDHLEEPLVENIVTDNQQENKNGDVESGHPIPPSGTTRYVGIPRSRSYYTLVFLLMVILLAATCLLGIFGTQYAYQQYKIFVGDEEEMKPEVYRAWGTISYGDANALPYENKQDNAEVKENINGELDPITKLISDLAMLSSADEAAEFKQKMQPTTNQMKAEFELDLDNDRYEKIHIPTDGNSRFIHDFYLNKTAIVDGSSHRCFVMPLDRTKILPPLGLYDLVFKMSNGYYSVDTEKIRHDMRVVLPPIDNIESYGTYISAECKGLNTYKLEEITGDRVRRSVGDSSSKSFKMFAGNVIEYNINIPN